jgi:hypothetical protein
MKAALWLCRDMFSCRDGRFTRCKEAADLKGACQGAGTITWSLVGGRRETWERRAK